MNAKMRLIDWKDIVIFLGYIPLKVICTYGVAFFCKYFLPEMGIKIVAGDVVVPFRYQSTFTIYTLFLSAIIAVAFIIFVYRSYLRDELRIFWEHKTRNMHVILIGFLIAFIVMQVMKVYLPYSGGTDNQEILQSLFVVSAGKQRWLLVLIMLVLAPIIEEIMLRKVLIGNVLTMGWGVKLLMSIVSAIVFGFFHFVVGESWLLFIPYATLGFILGRVYIYTENIFSSIILHMLNNVVALGGIYLIATTI